jgi:hypothetical protein
MPNQNESLPDRVEDTVYAWASTPNPVATTTALKFLWGPQANTVPYPDPATFQLINLLTQEFLSGPDARILRGLKPSLFADKAPIQSIDDLATWVQNAPRAEQHALITGFSNPKARAAFVGAVADEVVKRLNAAPATKPKKAAAKKR